MKKSEIENSDLLFITGYSGAGMSSVLKVLEDTGYEVFDNFPLSLVPALLDDQERPPAASDDAQIPYKGNHRIAIGLDTRTRGFDAETLLDLAQSCDAQILFIDCADHILQKRFTETRRRHPQAGNARVKDGIEKERVLLAPLQSASDVVINTTELSIHDLKHVLKSRFDLEHKGDLTLTLMSFGFKHGAPQGADIVMDVRFLKNPHWEKDLKPLTGKDAPVQKYIAQDEGYEPFLNDFKALLSRVLPRYLDEGKSYLTVAIGCTGGRHRSVCTIEALNTWLEGEGYHPHVEHRDL